MTQSNALIQLQTALTTALDTVAGVSVHDTYPEGVDVTYPIAVFGSGTAENDDSIGAAAGDCISIVRTTIEIYTDTRSRLDALVLGDTIETTLDTELTFDEGEPVGKPVVSPVTVEVDSGTGYWHILFEINQTICNL